MPVHALAGVWIVLGVARLRWGLIMAAFVLKSTIDALPGAGGAWLQGAYLGIGVVSALLLARLDRREEPGV